ncbi:putative glycosyltransferase [Singulisphaera acidiphila DSM 18658]|uniref:Putative glycosyltransferase n=1 Tax=Singulisphaera acidiphila (strain ATCC BAA-1392 / DSM 18658 / VKM B-2454 / MOB10) TaxID=886293 RepID=L0D817_SINAD|nr:putative glycosyltransferase [Singulisphaera acidiphila DSM 18658]
MLTMARGQGHISVIVPCLRGRRAARRCLVPLLRHTDASAHLVLVTNTRAGTLAAYLAGIRDAEPARVQVVVVSGLKRVRDAWRRGLREARREFVALLGPSTIVTDGWLDQLTALANADPSIGMVAPMSNSAPPLQSADGAPTAENVDAFAARWRAARLGRWLTTETLAGPCLFLKRGILEAISAGRALRSADLRADRLSTRIRQAGFQLAIANDLYVHRIQRPSTSVPSTKGLRKNNLFKSSLASMSVSAIIRGCTILLSSHRFNGNSICFPPRWTRDAAGSGRQRRRRSWAGVVSRSWPMPPDCLVRRSRLGCGSLSDRLRNARSKGLGCVGRAVVGRQRRSLTPD